MSEELARDVCRFSVSAPQMTSHVLKVLLNAMFAEGKDLSRIIRDGTTGELRLNDLFQKGGELQSRKITAENIGDFRETARKYHIDFSLAEIRDSEGVTSQVVFFQAKNVDVMERALREYEQTLTEEKPTLEECIEHAGREERELDGGQKGRGRGRSSRSRSRDRGEDQSVPPL